MACLFAAVPPLAAFGVYFGAWHGLRHTARLIVRDPRNGADLAAGRLLRPLRRFGVAAAVPTLVAAGSAAGLFFVAGRHTDLTGTVFTALLALTVPHLVVVAVFDLATPYQQHQPLRQQHVQHRLQRSPQPRSGSRPYACSAVMFTHPRPRELPHVVVAVTRPPAHLPGLCGGDLGRRHQAVGLHRRARPTAPPRRGTGRGGGAGHRHEPARDRDHRQRCPVRTDRGRRGGTFSVASPCRPSSWSPSTHSVSGAASPSPTWPAA